MLRIIPRFRAALAAAGVALALGGCASSVHTQLGDAKPDSRVSRARHMPIHGIDISRYQGDVDWSAVKAAGMKFVYMKATEGGDHLDPKFHRNWREAKAKGIKRGAYHFVYWCRPAAEQMAWFRQNVPNDIDSLPPVLDVEWNNFSRACPSRISRAKAQRMMATILSGMEAYTGKRPIIYTDPGFYRDILADGSFKDYPMWLRSVAAEPEYRYPGRKWVFWQYTTTGRVPGIRGNVDRNVFDGGHEQWAKWFQHNERVAMARLNGSQMVAPVEVASAEVPPATARQTTGFAPGSLAGPAPDAFARLPSAAPAETDMPPLDAQYRALPAEQAAPRDDHPDELARTEMARLASEAASVPPAPRAVRRPYAAPAAAPSLPDPVLAAAGLY